MESKEREREREGTANNKAYNMNTEKEIIKYIYISISSH